MNSVLILFGNVLVVLLLAENVVSATENITNDVSILEIVNYTSTSAFMYSIINFEKRMSNVFDSISDLNKDDVYLNVTELIRSNGYQVEEYEVETEDGYLLLLIRIRGFGPPIFLMHGLILSCDDWVTAGPDIGIGYLLAAQGYDVWMGNARGNKHSRKHKTLSPDTAEFWNFSFYEIGIHDLPAMIDFTLAMTKQEQLVYVGHSQGTTDFFILTSEKPEYNAKISLMIALAPAGSILHVRSLFFIFTKVTTFNNPQLFFAALRLIGIQELLPNNIFSQVFTRRVCSQSFFQETICRLIVDALAGYNAQQVYRPTLSTVYSLVPAGSSTKQFEHYGQTISSRRFAKFDYGKERNLKLYSSSIPPEFPIQNITTPIVFFYGTKDLLATPEDIAHLRSQISSIIETYEAPFSHLNFLYAKDLKKFVFDKMLVFIKVYMRI